MVIHCAFFLKMTLMWPGIQWSWSQECLHWSGYVCNSGNAWLCHSRGFHEGLETDQMQSLGFSYWLLSRNFTPFLLLRHLSSVDIRRYPRRWWIGPMLWWCKQMFAASDLVVVWSIWSASVAAANVGLTVGLQAVRKLNDAKKLESSAHYSADFGKE